MENDVRARSWFCVLNNPAEHGFTGTPEEIADAMRDRWLEGNPQRTCAVAYCISAEELHHCHAVFEDTKTMRFSAVQKLFPGMHIEVTKGNKEQAEDYINKRGKWQEKGETIVYISRHGEIKGAQGQRRDLEVIEDMLSAGMKPSEIMRRSLSYRRFDRLISDAYFDKRLQETPILRDLFIQWHVGPPGSGKSYLQIQLCEKYGPDEVYCVTDYAHPFDKYNGERVLMLDEFRGNCRFGELMSWLDNKRTQIPCRYTNRYALWNEVHICSVLPPETVYARMVHENVNLDVYGQLLRRLDSVIYHYVKNGEFLTYCLPASQYRDYDSLRHAAEHADDFEEIPEQIALPL